MEEDYTAFGCFLLKLVKYRDKRGEKAQIMPKKRTRSHQKDQMASGSVSYSHSDILQHENYRSSSVLTIPGLFVGIRNKGLSDYDSVWSPTSPLDFRVFSNIRNPFARSPRSPQSGHQKEWGSGKVGLSIFDGLDDSMKPSGKFFRSSESKNILFRPRMKIKNPIYQNDTKLFQQSKSLPEGFPVLPRNPRETPQQNKIPSVAFEIGDNPVETPQQFGEKIRSCSLDSCWPFSAHPRLSAHQSSSSLGDLCLKNTVLGSLDSTTRFTESLSSSEMELSEDYTYVISHCSNPKTTGIYRDCILDDSTDSFGNQEKIANPAIVNSTAAKYPLDKFLSFCHSCDNKLEEGKDIYIYRGEKSFCSLECRLGQILMDGEMEEVQKSPHKSPKPDEAFENDVTFTA